MMSEEATTQSKQSAEDVISLIQDVIAQAHIPRATYRLQFHPSFTFQHAQALVGYLEALGVSDLYASPLLKPRIGSQHGYDISDPTQLNPALGTPDDFESLVSALHQAKMYIILDTVPNHMGIGDGTNAWWMDVLENGPSSVYANYFDIEWEPVKAELANKVLLPILEDQYGQVLEAGKLRLMYEDGTFYLTHYSTQLPIAPGTYRKILEYPLETLIELMDVDNADLLEYQSILTALTYLPPRTETNPLRLAERNREKEIIKRRLSTLYESSEEIRACIDQTVETFNGRRGHPESFDLLDDLINAQAYRLAFWRVAAEEINYRRFFDINDLAAIRTEDFEVFQATHALILNLLAQGKVNGLRIDHIDGLYDPDTYLWRLQEQYVLQKVQALLPPNDTDEQEGGQLAVLVKEELERWHTAQRRREPGRSPQWPLYVVAEKILGEGENLPLAWAAYGTTGYDFLIYLNGLFVDRRNAHTFNTIYGDFTGQVMPFHDIISRTKKMIMLMAMASEIYNLSHQLERLAERTRRYRDFTLDTMSFALREVIAALPIYRTYVTDPETVTSRDRRFIELAVARVQRLHPRTPKSLFQFIKDVLLLRNLDHFRPQDQEKVIAWVRRFQQVTGPIMAKGVEDTAFYRYNRLASLNEVGGHPDIFGNSVTTFHERNTANQHSWPHTMLTTSTHDTKRSEDVRARINVLSELPDEWRARLEQWKAQNADYKVQSEDDTAPDTNDEYLFYQTLIGAWPFAPHHDGTGNAVLLPPSDPSWGEFRERIIAYMQKAAKEAKMHTSWINADQEYDSALNHFVRQAMDATKSAEFLASLRSLAEKVAYYGQFNALAQTLLKLTAPGVPDIYQGCELWDLSLVDPDNRRPVDFGLRQRWLGELRQRVEETAEGGNFSALIDELLNTSYDGRIKLFVTYRALDLRRRQDDLFLHGDYRPLEAQGPCAEYVVAFSRSYGAAAMVVAVPRLVAGLVDNTKQPPVGEAVWNETWLPLPDERVGQRYHNWLTGEVLAVESFNGAFGLRLPAIFMHFPVALLLRAT